MSKNENEKDDEELPKGTVARLFDMDTREVSLVDHPANKQRFLLVKRDGSKEVVELELSTAKVAAAPAQNTQAGPPAQETEKMTTPNSAASAPATTAPAAAAPAPAAPVSTPAPAPAAPVSKIGRPMNGERLERLKLVRKNLVEAIGEMKGGTVPLEKFDACAHDIEQIISECDVAKLLEKAKAQKTQKRSTGIDGATDMRGTTPDAPNMGAGVMPDPGAVAGSDAVFGAGVPAGVAEIVKSMKGRLDALEKKNGTLEKKNASLQGEVVSLKKFRDAPSALEEGEADAILHGGEAPEEGESAGEDVTWANDMAAERDAELEAQLAEADEQ